jgi:hypothetical protein
MKKLLIGAMFLLISVPAFAVPLGGPGVASEDRIRGTLEVRGLLKVEGQTVLNRISYQWPASQESGAYLKNEGKGKLSWQKEIVPGGPNGSLQFDQNGSFAGDGNLIWDNTAKTLKVGGGMIANGWVETADIRSKTSKVDNATVNGLLDALELRSNKLTVAGPLDARAITQAGVPVSLSGHAHSTADLTSGILDAAHGGTGSDNGSISAASALTFAAGGTDQNITLVPSGNGRVILQGGGLSVSGAVRSDTGFDHKGADGISGSYIQVTDIRLTEDGTLQKKVRTIDVSGGIITGLGTESDWADAGKISVR